MIPAGNGANIVNTVLHQMDRRKSMKHLLLFFALSLCAAAQTTAAMNAQDFHGVSIAGTLNSPTIKNASENQSVIGYTIIRHTDNGIDVPWLVMDVSWIAKGNPIGPGSERSMLGMGIGFKMEYLGPDKTWQREGEPTSYELTGVLFSDGTFSGTDVAWAGMSAHYAKVRSVARDIQATEDKYAAMANTPRMTARSAITSMANGDAESLNSRKAMSNILLKIRADKGEPESDRGLSRLASLPDMVRGE
jgi:hypothetical protein